MYLPNQPLVNKETLEIKVIEDPWSPFEGQDGYTHFYDNDGNIYSGSPDVKVKKCIVYTKYGEKENHYALESYDEKVGLKNVITFLRREFYKHYDDLEKRKKHLRELKTDIDRLEHILYEVHKTFY